MQIPILASIMSWMLHSLYTQSCIAINKDLVGVQHLNYYMESLKLEII